MEKRGIHTWHTKELAEWTNHDAERQLLEVAIRLDLLRRNMPKK